MAKLHNLYGQISSLQNGEWQHYQPQGYDAVLEHFRNQVPGYGEWAIFADVGGIIPTCRGDGCFYRMSLRLLACSKGFRLPAGYVLPSKTAPQEIHFCGEG